MPRRYAARAFSIIELLVVMGIISVLVSLLFPTIGRARESGRRASCASNLRQIGAAAIAFAGDHEGAFPMTYVTPVTASDRRRMPLLITRDDAITKGDGWRDYGTPWSEWNRYGATESIWHCPSSKYELKYVNGPDEPTVTPELWGPIVWTDYAYVGGMFWASSTKNNTTMSVAQWGMNSPAVSARQDRLSERFLATDAAFYAGNSKWSRQYQINHPQNGKKQAYVDAQNVLYADGHVADNGRGAYIRNGAEYPVGGSYYSLYVDSKGKIGGFHHWGVAVSYTPDKMVPPPVPPPVVTTPTPPTTPPAPTVPPPPPPPPTNVPDPL
jgi:prepilin-type N-terminal cleavage/methylation domain-containing protein